MSEPKRKSIYCCMEERLIRNSVLVVESGCWEWIGPRDKRHSTPYGKCSIYRPGGNRVRQAHIVSYETFIGPVPEGHELDHLCKNTFCINPNHLEPVDPAVNKERRTRVYRRHTKRTTTVAYA